MKSTNITVTFTESEARAIEDLLREIEADATDGTNYAASAPHMSRTMLNRYESARIRISQQLREKAS